MLRCVGRKLLFTQAPGGWCGLHALIRSGKLWQQGRFWRCTCTGGLAMLRLGCVLKLVFTEIHGRWYWWHALVGSEVCQKRGFCSCTCTIHRLGCVLKLSFTEAPGRWSILHALVGVRKVWHRHWRGNQESSHTRTWSLSIVWRFWCVWGKLHFTETPGRWYCLHAMVGGGKVRYGCRRRKRERTRSVGSVGGGYCDDFLPIHYLLEWINVSWVSFSSYHRRIVIKA